METPESLLEISTLQIERDALLKAAKRMLEIQASAVMRSEAVGETGVIERFSALRAAIAKVEKG